MHPACCTSFNVLHDVIAHARPPVILGNVLRCFCNSGVSCSDMVVKKGNHPPLKIVVSHNDKRGAFPPEVSGSMFYSMCFAPAIELDLILLEALHVQNLSFNVSIDVFIINISNPNWGLNIHTWDISALFAGRIVKKECLHMGWLS